MFKIMNFDKNIEFREKSLYF